MPEVKNPAETASQRALEQVYQCLITGQSFRLEAGAGAGKTYSLIKALRYLIEKNRVTMLRRNQKIACITYTNVAKDEIEARIDRSPLVICETNHAFCWSLIAGFQRQLRTLIPEFPAWQERLTETGGIGERTVEYSLGHRSIREDRVSLHHDDVIPLTIKLLEQKKFRQILSDRYPIILIDEYQDTDADWMEAIKTQFLGHAGSPQFGFFGDHWQKIYGNGCGKIEHPSITVIGKEANFRSVKTIVDCLNRMRPSLPQFVEDPTSRGTVRVFHSNDWTAGRRQTGAHWGGDLPPSVGHEALNHVKTVLSEEGWDFSPSKTKVLMLTHKLLASEQGYSNLANAFRYNDAFLAKEHPHIEYLVDVLEPVSEAYAERKFGAMFEALGSKFPSIRRPGDKAKWVEAMDAVMGLRDSGTVGDLIDHLQSFGRPRLPDKVLKLERDLVEFDRSSGEPLPDNPDELQKLRAVSYKEVSALRKYLAGYSPFETKHGVKGAEFENVLVVFGRGWNRYNFGEMLDLAARQSIPDDRLDMYERNRNLFYVACSRPKQQLALLFTQQLSDAALATLGRWFGQDTIRAVTF